MNERPSASPPAISFPVEYHVFTESARNEHLQGAGTLTIEPDGPRYVFSGQKRQLLAGSTVEMRFRPEHITNVTVTGRRVEFTANSAAQAMSKAGPFVFFARDEADAQSIARLLPAARERDFDEQRAFHARLDIVSPLRPAWAQATTILIALNVVAFVALAALGAGWFDVTDLTPYIRYGANNGAATTDGEWWRLVTSMFLHYGIIHLALNMWALYAAGRLMERLLGTTAFLLMYFGAGLAGGFASILWHGDQSWSAGASGAVFGVFGAILGFSWRQKQSIPPAVFRGLKNSTLSFVGYNVIFGLARSGIDNAAHFGGLAGGLALGWLLAQPLDAAVRARTATRLLATGAAALAVLIALGVALTPRFDYRVADEIALRDVSEKFADDERTLLPQHQSSLSQASTAAARVAHAAWMEEKLVPLYRDWRDEMRQLELTEGLATARRRDALVDFFELRLAAYAALIPRLRANDPDALKHYNADETKALEVLTRIKSGQP